MVATFFGIVNGTMYHDMYLFCSQYSDLHCHITAILIIIITTCPCDMTELVALIQIGWHDSLVTSGTILLLVVVGTLFPQRNGLEFVPFGQLYSIWEFPLKHTKLVVLTLLLGNFVLGYTSWMIRPTLCWHTPQYMMPQMCCVLGPVSI